jgi:hypothetical protein
VKINVVFGPPLSGKTTYVLSNKHPGDIIYDYDLIMSAITGRTTHDHDKTLNDCVIGVRQLLIDSAGRDIRQGTLWIIINKVSEQLNKETKGLPVNYIELDPGRDEVERRLLEDPSGRDITLWRQYIDSWYRSRETLRKINDDESEVFYHSVKWKRVRERVLKRDGYLCRECKRYGSDVNAEMVHHVKPFKDYPGLKTDTNNLISLCLSCHGKMHDRDSDQLTVLGKQWVRRIWGE